jgi:hypothetical protein
MSDPTADETDELAEILADPDRDTDILNSDLGDQGDSAESAPPATSASPTSASLGPVDETESLTDNADNTDAQPAEVSALASEPAAPALTPSPSEEQGPSLNTAQHTADATPIISQQRTPVAFAKRPPQRAPMVGTCSIRSH